MNKTNFSVLREQAGLSLQQFSEKSGYDLRTAYRWEKGEYEPKQLVLDWLQKNQEAENAEQAAPSQGKFTFIDLFAGIGGLRKAFESIGGECVFTSEWDLGCQKTYRANFRSNHNIAGDITKIEASEIPQHNVLLAGFPCQPFSIAGVSKKNSLGSPHGFLCSTQGTLFFDVARMIAWHKPEVFLLENVKNLISHDGGKTFATIMRTLRDELGYKVEYKIINAKSFVPQNRERIFIVGFRDATAFSFDDIKIPDVTKGPKLETILHSGDDKEQAEPPYTEGKNARVASKYTLSEKLWNYLKDYAEKHREKGNGFGFGLVGPEDVARTLSARYYKDGSEILVRQKKTRPRRLTPRECARLMGFDETGGELFKIVVSDTQAYKQFGNSVVVPVVKAVAKHMAPHIEQAVLAGQQKKAASGA